MTWIKVIDEKEAKDELKTIYNDIKISRGKLSNIMKIHSLNPKAMKKHMDFYLSIMFNKNGLSREEREFIGVVVSKINCCDYCINHHVQALNYYWNDMDKIKSFLKDFKSIKLCKRKTLILDYTEKLTNYPDKMIKKDVEKLKKSGFSDEEILNINLICSYFNFVNRIALGLGVKFSGKEASGYKY